MRPLPTSVRTRLTLWYTIALTVPLVGFAAASYLIFANTVRTRTDAFVGDALTVFARELGAERRAGPDIGDVIRRTLSEVHFREVYFLVIDDEGDVLGTSALPVGESGIDKEGVPPEADLRAVVSVAESTPPGATRITTVRGGREAYRVLLRPLVIDARAFRLAGIHSLGDVEEMLRRVRRLFLIAIPLIIALAAAGGAFLTRRSFRPVSAMAARAAEIGASTLHERLPVVANDELGELARVLNDLLDRLDRSFEQQRRFMTDASHELRTPTAIVRTEADVTLSREKRSEAEYRASMAIVQEASRRLTRIVEDVFLIARADAGHLVMNTEALYLADVARVTVRTVKPIADARGVNIELTTAEEAPMVGDVDLLDRLVLNLLDNAIKHTPTGGTINVSLLPHGGECRVSVVDPGPGIPPEAQEHIFERFFRLDVARSREATTLTSGAGLGLAICRRIAEMHGGRLELVSSRPGHTEFCVTLPLDMGAARASGTPSPRP